MKIINTTVSEEMTTERTWDEFRATGLFWFLNSILHVFGWSIVFEIDEGKITRVYPCRVKFRGFSEAIQTDAHKRIADYLVENASQLKEEAHSE